MVTVKVIPVIKKPKFIVVSKFTKVINQVWEIYYHYHLNDLSTFNGSCDLGVWRIKYKNPL